MRRVAGLINERVPRKGQVEHGAPGAKCQVVAALPASKRLQVGCSWIAFCATGFDHNTPDPTQVARNQQVSEHAQEAIDRGDYQQARVELLQLANEVPNSAEAKQRLGMVLQLEGRLTEAESCSSPCPRKRDPSPRSVDWSGTD